MILDDLIAALVALVELLVEGITFVIEPLVNLIAAGIEAVVGLVIPGFRTGRMKKRKPRRGAILAGLTLITVIGLACGWAIFGPKILNRTVTFVAEDGHSLTYAGVIVHTAKEDRHRRTNRQGELRIPRFATRALTLKDARYVGQRWEKSEIQDTLTARRTLMGSGLDRLADRLRRPAKEPEEE